MLHEIDLSRADLNLLVLFEAVMRDRNVGRAAARLNLSPSAVSHGLGRLRLLLGDPLFLRTPRGVVPTDRAQDLAPRIAEILAGVRGVLAGVRPFDPASARRHFRVGAADAVVAVFGAGLVARLSAEAPGISLSIVNVLPSFTGAPGPQAWEDTLARLDERVFDLAIIPAHPFPARFAARVLGEEVLVATARRGHPFLADPTLDTWCAARHAIVSQRGDPAAASDAVLAAMGRRREIVLTVPTFLAALAVAAASDILVSVPSTLAARHAARFGLGWRPLPVPLRSSRIAAVTTAAALRDDGIAWLVGLVAALAAEPLDRAAGPAQP